MKRKKTPALSVREQVAIARDKAVDTTAVIFLTVLCDKEGYAMDGIQRVWGEVNDLSDSIREGRVCVKDLKKVLREEYEIGLF